MKYERWEEMSPEKKFQAARWEASAETNNATTKQDLVNIVKYLVTLIEEDECPSCHDSNINQSAPIRVMSDELNDFIHASKSLNISDRLKVIIDLLEKAKGLMELELQLDSFYASMDYRSMSAYESTKYETGAKATEGTIRNLRRL